MSSDATIFFSVLMMDRSLHRLELGVFCVFLFFRFFCFLSHHDSTHSHCHCSICAPDVVSIPTTLPSPLNYLPPDTSSISIRSHLAILAKPLLAIIRQRLLIDLVVLTINISYWLSDLTSHHRPTYLVLILSSLTDYQSSLLILDDIPPQPFRTPPPLSPPTSHPRGFRSPCFYCPLLVEPHSHTLVPSRFLSRATSHATQ